MAWSDYQRRKRYSEDVLGLVGNEVVEEIPYDY